MDFDIDERYVAHHVDVPVQSHLVLPLVMSMWTVFCTTEASPERWNQTVLYSVNSPSFIVKMQFHKILVDLYGTSVLSI